MENLQEKEAVKEFMKLLMENRPEMGQEYAAMLRQVDSMAGKLDAALNELQEVKNQLSRVQEKQAVWSASRVAGMVEGRLHMVHDRLSIMKFRIAEGAKEAAENFRHMGVAALDKAVSGIGLKRALEDVKIDLDSSAADMQKSIERIEAIGSELRSVGGHVKNIARAVAGKEQQTVDGGREGRFQAAVLAPMRREKAMLDRLCSMVSAAISSVERLEQAAGRGRRTEKAVQQENRTAETSGGKQAEQKQAGSREEKPSVLKNLQEKKAEAAARPAPDRGRRPQEAAL